MHLFFTFFLGLMIFAMPAFARDFHVWLEQLRQDAVQFGISPQLVKEALPDTLAPDERIVRLDQKQPEGKIPYEKYKSNVLAPYRLSTGQAKMKQYATLLRQVSEAYKVEPEYIAALWGIETSFGRNTGGFEIIPALVTLAYEGRRGDFFRQELLKALRIVDQGNIGLHQMIGSWAGAMGQCQFMPTSYELYAQDFNKDGKRDIWTTESDVFASTAAYLSQSGWKQGQPWGVLVTLPKNFDINMIGPKIQKSPQFWSSLGVKAVNADPLPYAVDDLVSIVQPGGKGYKAYAVSGNYRILLKWNSSTYFATAVGQLADRLKPDEKTEKIGYAAH